MPMEVIAYLQYTAGICLWACSFFGCPGCRSEKEPVYFHRGVQMEKHLAQK